MGHPDPFLHLNVKLYHCIRVSLCIITHTFVSTGDNCFFCEINNSMLKFRNVKSTYTFSIWQIKVIIWDSLHCIVQQAEKNSFSPSKIVEFFLGGFMTYMENMNPKAHSSLTFTGLERALRLRNMLPYEHMWFSSCLLHIWLQDYKQARRDTLSIKESITNLNSIFLLKCLFFPKSSHYIDEVSGIPQTFLN